MRVRRAFQTNSVAAEIVVPDEQHSFGEMFRINKCMIIFVVLWLCLCLCYWARWCKRCDDRLSRKRAVVSFAAWWSHLPHLLWRWDILLSYSPIQLFDLKNPRKFTSWRLCYVLTVRCFGCLFWPKQTSAMGNGTGGVQSGTYLDNKQVWNNGFSPIFFPAPSCFVWTTKMLRFLLIFWACSRVRLGAQKHRSVCSVVEFSSLFLTWVPEPDRWFTIHHTSIDGFHDQHYIRYIAAQYVAWDWPPGTHNSQLRFDGVTSHAGRAMTLIKNHHESCARRKCAPRSFAFSREERDESRVEDRSSLTA